MEEQEEYPDWAADPIDLEAARLLARGECDNLEDARELAEYLACVSCD